MKGLSKDIEPLESTGGISRRRDIRLDASTQLVVSVPTARGPLSLRDVSVRGLCLVAQDPLPLKSRHRVTLTLGSVTFTHQAVTIHCRVNPGGGWLMGMEFVGDAPAQKFTIDDLVDRLLASAISFS